MGEIKELIKNIVTFRDERDWKQFHNSKELAIALSVETSELLESFLWKETEDANRDSLKEELADVFIYSLLLANEENMDVNEIIRKKLDKNEQKYPISKAKGTAKKYDEL